MNFHTTPCFQQQINKYKTVNFKGKSRRLERDSVIIYIVGLVPSILCLIEGNTSINTFYQIQYLDDMV